ncbi:MAG TPA: rhodanese-like domain-containing protein [Phycicoccus sp.]|mgnify:FL=1|jgi:rhodanese-related sulfurtransferase|nr:rhodanese-like domain-containing protein [Phycicoccus sp.]HQH06199.1 rhodanese-like domain-containing protein [Phycicoccus sp.]HQK30256.1 rhodanese-like domain-containing protein [Phycicoccus sp.]HQV91049.1 rhodanese-like domain-containing protein [Phycicoccus sp.]HRA43710.1 rhodanese-like domain-containing protein [Phycicoccus sp.]
MTRAPGDPLPRNARTLVDEASARVPSLSVTDVADKLDDPAYLIVDIRDPRELEREGQLPGAFRAPRGMLEFWVDPESPYYKPALDDGRTLVLYCGSAWRSALAAAALRDMGRDDVAHMAGGFSAWKGAGLPIEKS